MADGAIIGKRHADMACTAKNAIPTECGVKNIEMLEAIEKRQDIRPLSDRRTNSIDRRVEIVSLATDDNDIVTVAGVCLRDRRNGERDVALGALDAQAVGSQQRLSLRLNASPPSRAVPSASTGMFSPS
jgi:hypothetical protein